jgi:DNA-binding transcriptional LysR family regulator
MNRFEDIQTFVKVVEAQGFTQAARELGVSKSVVSRRIGDLEDRLGARLLNRTTRRLSPTELGQAFYDRCARIAADVEEAEAAVANLQTAPRGTLRLTAPASLGRGYLAQNLTQFMSLYPDILVDVLLSDRVVDLVEEGLDVAIRVGQLRDSSLVARKLGQTTVVVVGSPAYLDRYGTPTELGHLAEHDCLVYTGTGPSEAWRYAGPDGPRAVRVRARMLSNDGQLLCEAAVCGHGLTFLPSFLVAEAVRDGHLRVVLKDTVQNPLGIYAIYPHSRHLTPKVRALVDFLRQSFGTEPPWERILHD